PEHGRAARAEARKAALHHEPILRSVKAVLQRDPGPTPLGREAQQRAVTALADAHARRARRERPVGERRGVAAGGQGVAQPRAADRHELYGTPRVRTGERAILQELRA